MRLTGHVSDGLHAVVRVRVGNAPGNAVDVAAVVDTGFTGFLSLRPKQISSLGLRYHGIRKVILAHGRIKPVRTYKATVWRGDEQLTAEVFEMNHNPLLG